MAENTILNPWAPERWTIPEEKIISSLPKITIGILSYNRRDDLRRTLDCITLAVQYQDVEVIVVDNASSDGSVGMMRTEFPNVKVIALEKNIGTSARNKFYDEAKGKYVFSFDDDSSPATPATIVEAVSILELQPEIDSLTLLCYQPLSGYTETGDSQDIYLSETQRKKIRVLAFAEGAMCIRSSSWKKIEGYDADFFWGAEGVDLTFQMYEKEMNTMYYPGLAILHMKSGESRNVGKNYYLFTRNHIWTLSKHFPLYAEIPLIFLYILRKIITVCLHPKFTVFYLKGIKDGVLGISAQRKKRKKLNLRQVLGLKRWYLFLYRW